MPRSETTWFCCTCNAKHETEEKAQLCEDSHYEVVDIEFPVYEPLRKCPQRLVVNVRVGDDVKQVTYIADQEGWGGK